MLTAANLKLRENSSPQNYSLTHLKRCKILTHVQNRTERLRIVNICFLQYFVGRFTEIVFKVDVEALETVSRCVSYRLLKINDDL